LSTNTGLTIHTRLFGASNLVTGSKVFPHPPPEVLNDLFNTKAAKDTKKNSFIGDQKDTPTKWLLNFVTFVLKYHYCPNVAPQNAFNSIL